MPFGKKLEEMIYEKTELKIRVSDYSWRVFKRVCEHTENNGKPFPKEENYFGFLETALMEYSGELVPTDVHELFLLEALREILEEKEKRGMGNHVAHSTQTKFPSPDENMG
tara:strand:+ start:634 stop:966 length:333 start_codon:yes stop_codon:yes gene_type:complete